MELCRKVSFSDLNASYCECCFCSPSGLNLSLMSDETLSVSRIELLAVERLKSEFAINANEGLRFSKEVEIDIVVVERVFRSNTYASDNDGTTENLMVQSII